MRSSTTKPQKGKPTFTPSAERRGQRRLADNLRRLTRGLCAQQGFAQAEVITHWRDIVGSHLADHCLPEKLSFGKGQAQGENGGTLHIVAGGAIAPELQHMTPQLIARINGYFGFPAVARLSLRQAPVSLYRRRRPKPRPLSPGDQKALAELTGAVANPALKAALDRLGAAILGTTPDPT